MCERPYQMLSIYLIGGCSITINNPEILICTITVRCIRNDAMTVEDILAEDSQVILSCTVDFIETHVV